MFLHYTKLHSFLFYKFPALKKTYRFPPLFIQRDLFLCTLLYHRCSVPTVAQNVRVLRKEL